MFDEGWNVNQKQSQITKGKLFCADGLVWSMNVNNFSMKTRYQRMRNLFEEQLALFREQATQPGNLIACLCVCLWSSYLKALQLDHFKLIAAKLQRKWTVGGNPAVIDRTSPLSLKAEWHIN